MNQPDLLSVIVPVYNVEQYLPRCVDSILAQTYRNLEIILVEDGTQDASGEICDAYAAKDPRIQVIHKENGGLSSARNAGLDVARGEYVAFVDSDDWIEPEAYAHMLALARKYDAKLVCAGRYDVDGQTGQRQLGLCPQKEELITGEEMAGRIFLWDGCDSAAWDKLYHRSLFRELRYPVGMVCEDVPVTYRLALLAGQAVMCDRPVYNYYHRPGSITTAAVSEKTFHFSQHTAIVYPYIRDNYPRLEAQARYFRVRSVAYNLVMLEQAEEAVRARFSGQYRASRKALGKHAWFILTSAYFGRKERAHDLFLILGLYRPLWRLSRRVKNHSNRSEL